MKQKSVLGVIVIYETVPGNSTALTSLLASAASCQSGNSRLQVLLYDNTPESSMPAILPNGVVYYAAGSNNGVSGAYNYALDMAQANGQEWLLLLDQDTALPHDFVDLLFGAIDRVADDRSIGAIVPTVTGRGRHISPFWEILGAIPRPFREAGGVTAVREVKAINSGSCIRVSATRQIGGFSSEFWLDCCDFEFFKRLQLYGKRIHIAANIRVTHELSLLDMSHQMSYERYQASLEAQSRFADVYVGRVGRYLYLVRLLVRWLVQRTRRYSVDYARLTLKSALAGMFTSRQSRAKKWQARCARRGSLKTHVAIRERALVSICMATYNGEMYIKEQIDSILAQLSASDELVIVDDASTDGTRACIEAYRDPRILLLTHCVNKGVNKSFENALRQASGDIIFLSDQDDTWHQDKIATFLAEFRRSPEIDVVTCDACGIDHNGNQIFESWQRMRGGFSASFWDNLWRSRYLGCTMAFRSRILPKILPLPATSLVVHDLWIGLRNVLSGGGIRYVHQPLVAYRRHNHNVTQRLSLTMRVLRRGLTLMEFATRMAPRPPYC